MKETNSLLNIFLAMSDSTRLRLLCLMRHGEICVNSFTEVLGESQPKISRHLAYLRRAGLVNTRRRGKNIYYRLNDVGSKDVNSFLVSMLLNIPKNEQFAADLAKLKSINVPILKTTKTLHRATKKIERIENEPVAYEPAEDVNSEDESYFEDQAGLDHADEITEFTQPQIDRRGYNELEDFLL